MQRGLEKPRSRGREATRAALIEAGERLYARHGIDGASLLAIAREAGQANKYAVQYHFGGREPFIRAILEERAAWLDARRCELREKICKVPSVAMLIEVIMLPLAEMVDERGERCYARFLLQFMTQFEPWPEVRHPLREHDVRWQTLPSVTRELAEKLPHLPRNVLYRRLTWLFRAYLGVLVDFDNAGVETRRSSNLRTQIEDFIGMSVAALESAASPTGDAPIGGDGNARFSGALR